jgi:hypothetical protein
MHSSGIDCRGEDNPPALLEAVPIDDAAEMSANGGQFVKLVCRITVDSDLADRTGGESETNDLSKGSG